MEEITEPERQIPSEVPLKQCLDCAEDIKSSANFCRYCRKAQGGLLRFLEYYQVIALSVSIGLLLVAVLNFFSTRDQLSQAKAANLKAEEVSKKVEAIEGDVSRALENVLRMEKAIAAASTNICNVALSLADIAEVIPRTTQGAVFESESLPEKDRLLLKEKILALRKECS